MNSKLVTDYSWLHFFELDVGISISEKNIGCSKGLKFFTKFGWKKIFENLKFYKKNLIFPIFTMKTGFLGTLLMLEFAHKKNAKLLFTSTSEVYGDPDCEIQS